VAKKSMTSNLVASLTMVATAVVGVLGASVAVAQASRDYVYIVGSSTVYPFATVVAERFGRGSDFKTPKVESTGSGGGLKLFCDGIGVDYPDIANASRAIKQSEVDTCMSNGVSEIMPWPIQRNRASLKSPVRISSWRWPSRFPETPTVN